MVNSMEMHLGKQDCAWLLLSSDSCFAAITLDPGEPVAIESLRLAGH